MLQKEHFLTVISTKKVNSNRLHSC